MQDVYMCGAVLLLIILDIASGYINAIMKDCVSSSKMRQGILKKCGDVCVMLCAIVVEHCGGFVGINESITGAIVSGICALLCVMELTSVLENSCKINSDLPFAQVFGMFGLSEKEKDND